VPTLLRDYNKSNQGITDSIKVLLFRFGIEIQLPSVGSSIGVYGHTSVATISVIAVDYIILEGTILMVHSPSLILHGVCLASK